MSGRIGIRNEAASESGKGVNSEDAKTRSGNYGIGSGAGGARCPAFNRRPTHGKAWPEVPYGRKPASDLMMLLTRFWQWPR
jgi:hypothetical protein